MIGVDDAMSWNTELAEIDNPRFRRYDDPAEVADYMAGVSGRG